MGNDGDGPKSALGELKSTLVAQGHLTPHFHRTAPANGEVLALAPLDGTMALLRQSMELARSSRLSRLVAFSPQQHLYAVEALGLREDQVDMVPPPVDDQWFTPAAGPKPSGSDTVLIHGFPSGTQFPGLFRGLTLTPVSGGPESRRSSYHRGSLIVLGAPSRSASGGLQILLEAMACGLPVIAPRTFTMEFLLADGENCLVYDPGDRASLERCIRRAEGDPDLARDLGQAARRFVRDHASLRLFVARVGLIATRFAAGENASLYYIIPGRIALAP